MALLGFSNQVTSDIYMQLMKNDKITKFLYYNKELDTDINELPSVSNPVGKLKNKVFLNRRLEKLQREADVGMTINIYSKASWKEDGRKNDTTLLNIVEVGVCCHEKCDDTINGSRTYALIDLVLSELNDFTSSSLGKLHFMNMYKTKDLPIEFSGYLMYFEVYNVKEAL